MTKWTRDLLRSSNIRPGVTYRAWRTCYLPIGPNGPACVTIPQGTVLDGKDWRVRFSAENFVEASVAEEDEPQEADAPPQLLIQLDGGWIRS